jgi:hypothetical protein
MESKDEGQENFILANFFKNEYISVMQYFI